MYCRLLLIYTRCDCNEWRTEKRHECANMGKLKRLELWWQLYRTSLPVWELENFRPMDFCWHECTSKRPFQTYPPVPPTTILKGKTNSVTVKNCGHLVMNIYSNLQYFYTAHPWTADDYSADHDHFPNLPFSLEPTTGPYPQPRLYTVY